MPILNWHELHKTKDVSHLMYRKLRRDLKWYEKIFLFTVWEKLTDEYITRFGISDEQWEINEKYRQVAVLKLRKIKEGASEVQLYIDIKKQELEDLLSRNKDEQNDVYQIKPYIEKALGFQIDIKSCTVVEFYNYIEIVKKINRANR